MYNPDQQKISDSFFLSLLVYLHVYNYMQTYPFSIIYVCNTCDRTTSGSGPLLGSTWAILDEARTQSTHISTILYIEVQVEVITT
jgi:hypothetical protein